MYRFRQKKNKECSLYDLEYSVKVLWATFIVHLSFLELDKHGRYEVLMYRSTCLMLLSEISKTVCKGSMLEVHMNVGQMKSLCGRDVGVVCWVKPSERATVPSVLNMALSWPHFGQDNEHPWKAFLSFLPTFSSLCPRIRGAYLCKSSICASGEVEPYDFSGIVVL